MRSAYVSSAKKFVRWICSASDAPHENHITISMYMGSIFNLILNNITMQNDEIIGKEAMFIAT